MKKYTKATGKEKELIECASNGEFDKVRYLVDTERIDYSVEHNQAFVKSAENSHLDIVEYFLDLGVDPNTTNFSALKLCALRGDWRTLDLLCSRGGDIHCKDDWLVVLAARGGNLPVLEFLVEYCNLNPEAHDNLALINAAENGYLDIVKYLVRQGADPLVDANLPLSKAAEKGHFHIAEYLVNAWKSLLDTDDQLSRPRSSTV